MSTNQQLLEILKDRRVQILIEKALDIFCQDPSLENDKILEQLQQQFSPGNKTSSKWIQQKLNM